MAESQNSCYEQSGGTGVITKKPESITDVRHAWKSLISMIFGTLKKKQA